MTCRECSSAKKGYFASDPNKWVCTGVKEPFIINDLDVECTEYEERRDIVVNLVLGWSETWCSRLVLGVLEYLHDFDCC